LNGKVGGWRSYAIGSSKVGEKFLVGVLVHQSFELAFVGDIGAEEPAVVLGAGIDEAGFVLERRS